jgi:hypothetical protein
MTIAKWGFALAVGGFLLMMGFMKLSGAAHIFPYIEFRASAAGVPLAGLFFPLANNATGALEILAGGMLIAPATRRMGSYLAVLPFLGAVLFHLSPLLGVLTPTGYADPKPVDVISAGGPFARTDFSAAESNVLFIMAAAGLAAAIINLIVQRTD